MSEDDKKEDDKTGDKSLIENIVKGERAVLIEVDLSKKREERNKLLRFNNNTFPIAAKKSEMVEEPKKTDNNSKP